jgi:hypothetical protein
LKKKKKFKIRGKVNGEDFSISLMAYSLEVAKVAAKSLEDNYNSQGKQANLNAYHA